MRRHADRSAPLKAGARRSGTAKICGSENDVTLFLNLDLWPRRDAPRDEMKSLMAIVVLNVGNAKPRSKKSFILAV
jgi:hypothetical protein